MKAGKRTGNKKETALKASIVVVVFAFLASAVVYGIMLWVEKKALAEEEKAAVWIITKPIKQNQVIEQEKMSEYVETKEFPKSLIPQGAIAAQDSLPYGKACCEMGEGTVLREALFQRQSVADLKYKEPVVVTVEIADLTAAVGGILRQGDRINLYVFKEDAEIGRFEEVVVEQVFDNSGVSVPGEEQEKPATRVNVYLERAEAAEFYRLQQDAVVRTAKLLK